jgi:simple sugar transport system substrate-binding protein
MVFNYSARMNTCNARVNGARAMLLVPALLAALAGASCRKAARLESIAVFIPGVRAGSAIYDMLASGVERAVAEWSASHGPVTLNVIEGGYNQAEWEDKMTALAASGRYGVIISSNPSMPAIAADVLRQFPAQRFILFDGAAGGKTVYSLRYNQREQGFMAGHIAALVTGALGGREKIGLVAGQEYPAMNEVIMPAYLEGAQAVSPAYTVDFRIVGNWFDAQKAADLAQDMIRGGVSVILAVAGGANEGVLQAASEAGVKVVWFDTNGYALKPGVVVGSSVIHQDKAAYEKTLLFLNDALVFGRAEEAGVREGYVDFVEDDPVYRETVGEAVRQQQAALVERIRVGDLALRSSGE